jgi:hypothetical protein
MTLKDKFKIINCKDCDIAYCDTKCTILAPSELIKLEQVADDFAIGFAEWYLKVSEKYDSHLKLQNDSKQLLEIYKKEKGL